MESAARYPTRDLLNGPSLSYTPRDDIVWRRMPSTLPIGKEGTDIQWVFPAGAPYSIYTSPLLEFDMITEQPFDPNDQTTMVPSVMGDPWIGLYALFRNWRIMIGGATRKTATAIELRAWMDYMALTLSKEDWSTFQRETRCRYTHVSEQVSGAAAEKSAYNGMLPFYRAEVNKETNTAKYWCRITLPIPFWQEIVPLNSEQSKAYPFGVIPMGVFQEPITIIATFQRGDTQVPRAPTVYYETVLDNSKAADHTTTPVMGRSRNQCMGNTDVISGGQSYLDSHSDYFSAWIPSIMNMSDFLLTTPSVAVTDPVLTAVSEVSWTTGGFYRLGVWQVCDPDVTAQTLQTTFRNYTAAAPADQVGFLDVNTSPNAWWAGHNIGARSTVGQFGPACQIKSYTAPPTLGTATPLPRDILTSYVEWASGSTGYLQFNGHLQMPGSINDYIPPALIGISPDIISGPNGVDCSIDGSTRFTNLLDPTIGLRNSSQIAVLARVDKLEPCSTFSAQTYHPQTFMMIDPALCWVNAAITVQPAAPLDCTVVPVYPNLAVDMSDGYSKWARAVYTLSPQAALSNLCSVMYPTGALPRCSRFLSSWSWSGSYYMTPTVYGNATDQLFPNPPALNVAIHHSVPPNAAVPVGNLTTIQGITAMCAYENTALMFPIYYGFYSSNCLDAAANIYATPFANQVDDLTVLPTPVFGTFQTAADFNPPDRTWPLNVNNFFSPLALFRGSYDAPGAAVLPDIRLSMSDHLADFTYLPNRRCLRLGQATYQAVEPTAPAAQVTGPLSIPLQGVLPPLYNLGGGFAGQNTYHTIPPPFSVISQMMTRNCPPAFTDMVRKEYFDTRSIAPVLTSKWFFNDRNNVHVRWYNYVAGWSYDVPSTNLTEPTVANIVQNGGAQAPVPVQMPRQGWLNSQVGNIYPTMATSASMRLISLSEYKPSSSEYKAYGPVLPGYCLDLVSGFVNPLGSTLDYPVGTFDNTDWLLQSGPILSGYQSIEFQRCGQAVRPGNNFVNSIDNASFISQAGMPTTIPNLTTTLLNIPAAANIDTYPTVNYLMNSNGTLNPQFASLSASQYCAGDPMTSDRIRNSVFTSRKTCMIDGSGDVLNDVETDFPDSIPTGTVAGLTASIPGRNAHIAIPMIGRGVDVFAVYQDTTTGTANAMMQNVHANEALYNGFGKSYSQPLPLPTLTAASQSFGTVLESLWDFNSPPPYSLVNSNLNPEQATQLHTDLVGQSGPGGFTNVKYKNPGHFKTDSCLNMEQIYTPFPRVFVGVIGGGYGALGINQLASYNVLDCVNIGTCHTANPYTAEAGMITRSMAEMLFRGKIASQCPAAGQPYESRRGTQTNQWKDTSYDALVKTGNYAPFPAPYAAHQVNAALTCIVASPAYPDRIASGSRVNVTLANIFSKWGELSGKKQGDVNQSFTAARELLTTTGLPTLCTSQEVLLFTIPPGTTNPMVSFNIQGNNVFGILVRVISGTPYQKDWQDMLLTNLTMTVGADTVMPLTSDLLYYPVRPRYLDAESVLSLVDYPPSIHFGTGVHIIPKLGLNSPYSLELQKVLWQAVDTTVDWNFDRLNLSNHHAYSLPFATAGPVEMNANIVLRMTVAPHESNTYLPILQFNQVPHPSDIVLNPMVTADVLAPVAFYSWPVTTQFQYPFSPKSTGFTPTTRTYQLQGGAETYSTYWDPSPQPALYCYPGSLSLFQSAFTFELLNNSVTAYNAAAITTITDDVNAGIGAAQLIPTYLGPWGYYTWNFQGPYDPASFPGGLYFPPEWLLGVRNPCKLGLMENSVIVPEYCDWNDMTQNANNAPVWLAAGGPGFEITDYIMPTSYYQPFGINEYHFEEFSPSVAGSQMTVEVTIIRAQQGLLRNNIYATRM